MTQLPRSRSDRSRRYAVVGAGALGGFYGGRLAHAGFEVHFLLRSDADHVRQHGLRVDSPDGSFHVQPIHAYADPREMPPCDIVLVCLKTTQNDALPNILPAVVGQRANVVVMQNGLGVEEQTAAVVGDARVLGGLCFVCSNKVAPGHVQHLAYGRVALGEHSGVGVTPRMKAIATDLDAAGVPVTLEPDLLLARWKKLVWNVPYNGLCTLHGKMTDAVMADPALRREVEALMAEVVAAAKAADDREIPPAFVQQMIDDTLAMGPYKPSMMIDREQARPLEVDAILGEPLRRAQRAGCNTPHLAKLHAALANLR